MSSPISFPTLDNKYISGAPLKKHEAKDIREYRNRRNKAFAESQSQKPDDREIKELVHYLNNPNKFIIEEPKNAFQGRLPPINNRKASAATEFFKGMDRVRNNTDILDYVKNKQYGGGGKKRRSPKRSVKRKQSGGEYYDKHGKERNTSPTRKAPGNSAGLYQEGTERVGIDGNIWHVVIVSNGAKRWKLLKNGIQRPIHSQTHVKTNLVVHIPTKKRSTKRASVKRSTKKRSTKRKSKKRSTKKRSTKRKSKKRSVKRSTKRASRSKKRSVKRSTKKRSTKKRSVKRKSKRSTKKRSVKRK